MLSPISAMGTQLDAKAAMAALAPVQQLFLLHAVQLSMARLLTDSSPSVAG